MDLALGPQATVHRPVHGHGAPVGQDGSMEPTRLDPPTDLVEFTCPRCERDVSERLYGPCEPCRAELRATLGSEQRAVAAAEYVPKVNVTPNAVALKD